MKVLIIHQYFKIPTDGGGIRSYYLAKGLVSQGHEVSVLTAHNEKEYCCKKLEGIEVHYLPVFYSNELSTLRRIHAYGLFALKVLFLAGQFKHFDLCYTISTPLSVGLPALWIKKIHNIPYFFEVGDLWPEAPIQMGIIKNKWLQRVLYAFERRIYRESKKVIALSPSIENYIRGRVPTVDIETVPNMSDLEFFYPREKPPSASPRQFTIGYFGTVGLANRLEYLLDLQVACLAKGLDVRILIVGGGARFEPVRKKAEALKLRNISFHPHSGKERIQELMAFVDAVYISFQRRPVLEMGSPNKFFDGLAAGKIIILNFKGWLKEVVERSECGIYIHPKKPESDIGALRTLIEDETLAAQYKKNARCLAQQEFSRNRLVMDLVHLIEEVEESSYSLAAV